MKFEESVKKNKNQDLKLLAYNVKRLRIDNKLMPTEWGKNAGKSLKTLEKTGVTWYNVCKRICDY